MMKLEHPQEVEVWYVIPGIKKELTLSMIKDYGMKQKQVANILGITESAVSQYINSKRANDIVFNEHFKQMIKQSAKEIVDRKSSMVREIQMICYNYRQTRDICELHKKYGLVYEDDCKACEVYYD